MVHEELDRVINPHIEVEGHPVQPFSVSTLEVTVNLFDDVLFD